MTWNFWRDAHTAAMAGVTDDIKPRWSTLFVGLAAATATSCAAPIALYFYELPYRTPATLLIGGSLLAVVPAIYVSKLLKYPADLSKRLTSDLCDARKRLRSNDVEESSIIALSEYLSEMKLLQGERIRHPEQLVEWTDRFQRMIHATYIILSKGVSSNVAMVYVSCPVADSRYIRGCFNDDHMKTMFALSKYIDKLQCIIDGYFMTAQHTKAKPVDVGDHREAMPIEGAPLLLAA